MRTKIVVVGLIAAGIYFRGARSHRPIRGKQPETLRHQAERLWKDPKAAKARKKFGKRVARTAANRIKKARNAA